MTTHITKTWFDDGKVVTKEIPESEAYKQEPVAWRNAVIRLGEELSSVGPDGYYNMTAEQWLDWALEQQPRGKNSLTTPPAAQRQPLTEEQLGELMRDSCGYPMCPNGDDLVFARAIEAAHGITGEKK